MTHPLGETTVRRVDTRTPQGDPVWLKVLRAVALGLGIVVIVVFLYSAWTLYSKFQEIQEALQGPADPPVSELDMNLPVDPPSLNEGDVEGTYEVCDVDPDGVPFCEEITE